MPRRTRPATLSRMNTRRLSALLLLLLLTACNPPAQVAPTFAVTQARQAVVMTPIISIVTLTPRPTVTPTPAPTFAFNLANVTGRWVFAVEYHFYNQPQFSDIRYNGSIELTVAEDASVSGRGRLYIVLQQPPCIPGADPASLDLAIRGTLTADSNGNAVGLLTIIPGDVALIETFTLTCSAAERRATRKMALLWPALSALDQLEIRLQFTNNSVLSTLRGLTGPSSGVIVGALASEYRLSR